MMEKENIVYLILILLVAIVTILLNGLIFNWDWKCFFARCVIVK